MGNAGEGKWALREAQAGDVEFEYQLFASVRGPEFKAVGWQDAPLDLFLRDQFRMQTQHYRNAFPDLKKEMITIAGHRGGRLLTRGGEERVHIVDIALLPEFRGLGIGSAILAELLKRADVLGLPASLHVERENPARSWYARRGFVEGAAQGPYLYMERAPHQGAGERIWTGS